jgi:hypothetical protein
VDTLAGIKDDVHIWMLIKRITLEKAMPRRRQTALAASSPPCMQRELLQVKLALPTHNSHQNMLMTATCKPLDILVQPDQDTNESNSWVE